MPIMTADLSGAGIANGDEIEVDLTTGSDRRTWRRARVLEGRGFSDVQMEIYQRGGLLAAM